MRHRWSDGSRRRRSNTNHGGLAHRFRPRHGARRDARRGRRSRCSCHRRIHHEHGALEFGGSSTLEVEATFLAFHAVIIVLRPTIRAKHASTSVRTESHCSHLEPTERTLRKHAAQANLGRLSTFRRPKSGVPWADIQYKYLELLPIMHSRNRPESQLDRGNWRSLPFARLMLRGLCRTEHDARG